MSTSTIGRLADAMRRPDRRGPDTAPARGAVLRYGTITALGTGTNAGLVKTDVGGDYWHPVHAGYQPFVGDLVYLWQQGPVSHVGGKLTPPGSTVRALRTDANAMDAALRLTATGVAFGGALSTLGGTTALVGGVLEHAGGLLGFYGQPVVARRTVSGSRGGNAALASLLTALEAVGLITNNSTA